MNSQCFPGKYMVSFLFWRQGKCESHKSLPLPNTFLHCPKSCITKLPCSFWTPESKPCACSFSWPGVDQSLFLLSGGHQSKVRILAPSSYPCFQEVHRRHFVRLALHLNTLLFFSVISADGSSGSCILCGFSPVELGAVVIPSVFKEAVDWMWLFQWSSESQHLLVSWCWQLNFSGRTFWRVCILCIRASHDGIAVIVESQLPHTGSSRFLSSALDELRIVDFQTRVSTFI